MKYNNLNKILYVGFIIMSSAIVSVQAMNYRDILQACNNNNVDSIKKHFAEEEMFKNALLAVAISKNNDEIVDIVLNNNTNFMMRYNLPHQKDLTILHLAVMSSHQVFESLLKRNNIKIALIDQQDRDGMTPLHYAVGFKKADMIKTLVDYGAKSNIKNKSNLNAYEYALSCAPELADLLEVPELSDLLELTSFSSANQKNKKREFQAQPVKKQRELQMQPVKKQQELQIQPVFSPEVALKIPKVSLELEEESYLKKQKLDE